MNRQFIIVTGAVIALFIILATVVAYQQGSACKPFKRRLESPFALVYCYRAAGAAQAYYHALTAGDIVRAARYVAYYETFSDVPPTTPVKQLERAWVQRVTALKSQGTFISRVNSIEVITDDGYPKGIASVTLIEHGQERIITQRIHFDFETRDVWKIESVDSGGKADMLDNALSGHVP